MDEKRDCNPFRENDENNSHILAALSAGFAAGVAATLAAVKLLKGLSEK